MASSAAPAIRWSVPLTAPQVLQMIRSERDVQKALHIFDSASGEYASGYRHDHHTFAFMAARLASAGLPRPAESLLFRAFSELGEPPAEPSFLPVLRAYSRCHLPHDVLRLFRRMAYEFLLQPSHRSYNTVLASLVANNRPILAKNLFKEMKNAGVPFTVASFNILIKAICSSAASIDTALRVFRSMPDRGCLPDSCTYNTLIDGLCRRARVDDAQKLFDEMQQKGCLPTVVTFTSLMHGLSRFEQFEEALKLFNEMCKSGVKPNVITYSSLIDGFCRGGRALEAMGLLEKMGRQGCLPNVITYSSLINGLCSESRLKEALEVFDKMRLQGRKPDAVLYGKLIKALCESNRFQEAANYLDEMVFSGILPNRLTWLLHVRTHNTVIRGLCRKDEIIRAFHVYLATRNRGISIEPETYGLLVASYCKKRDADTAAIVINEMMIDGLFPDITAWSSVLEAYWGRRKVRQAVEIILDELISGGG
ncbi:Pentatricopeptide repeat-containing protein [Apostasia shenzhenica]|uniref:Pentatricopeptide repeat-containing protein n=1 Tax=Apostasia shenzhenica TaxID=1088818 RepID=A0A2I0A3S4_9ASPA|nr:Pentatricopeptide repeat-containing protein [Apostasia shenzhenica]